MIWALAVSIRRASLSMLIAYLLAGQRVEDGAWTLGRSHHRSDGDESPEPLR